MDEFDYTTDYGRQFEPPDWDSIPAPIEPLAAEPQPEPERPQAAPKRGSAADYPYNAGLRVEMQVGLEKLRCVPDRELAQQLYDLHVYCEPKWAKGGVAEKWREAEARKRDDDDLAHLTSLAERAFKGEFGEPLKQLANQVLVSHGYRSERRTDLPALRQFEFEFKKMRRAR